MTMKHRIAFIALLVLASGILLVWVYRIPSHNSGAIADRRAQPMHSEAEEIQRKMRELETLRKILERYRKAQVVKYVRLDNQVEMSILKKDDPDLYGRVLAILREARTVPSSGFGLWIKTHHQADSGQISDILLTSLPPQRYMSFTLEGVRFSGTVRISHDYDSIK